MIYFADASWEIFWAYKRYAIIKVPHICPDSNMLCCYSSGWCGYSNPRTRLWWWSKPEVMHVSGLFSHVIKVLQDCNPTKAALWQFWRLRLHICSYLLSMNDDIITWESCWQKLKFHCFIALPHSINNTVFAVCFMWSQLIALGYWWILWRSSLTSILPFHQENLTQRWLFLIHLCRFCFFFPNCTMTVMIYFLCFAFGT